MGKHQHDRMRVRHRRRLHQPLLRLHQPLRLTPPLWLHQAMQSRSPIKETRPSQWTNKRRQTGPSHGNLAQFSCSLAPLRSPLLHEAAFRRRLPPSALKSAILYRSTEILKSGSWASKCSSIAAPMTRTNKRLSHSSSKSKFVYDNCYSRLDQPLPGRTFRIHQKHDVHPDPLWKFYMPYNAHDQEQLLQMRHSRNLVIKEQLQKGNNLQFCCSGLSMYPAMQEGDLCVFEPVL